MSQDEKKVVTDVLGFGKAIQALTADPLVLLIVGGVIFALVYGKCWQ